LTNKIRLYATGKKSGSARRGPADPLALVKCIRLVLALGGWGARKPS
jgi:hypothetical protein